MNAVLPAILSFAVVSVAAALSWDYYVPDRVPSLMLGAPITFAITWLIATVTMSSSK